MKRCPFFLSLLLAAVFAKAGTTDDIALTKLPNATERTTEGSRMRAFASLYMSRYDRDVTPEILPFATTETGGYVGLQTRAIIALGRLEDGRAEEPLQKLLLVAMKHFPSPYAIPFYRVQLALGRVRARDLKGKEKLETIARSAHLSWAQVQGFGDQLKEAGGPHPAQSYLLMRSFELEVVKEFIDVIRSMERRGENVDDLGVEHLIYTPLIAPLVFTGKMSREEEAKFWLQRSAAPTQYVLDPAVLVGLGNEVKPLLQNHLQTELKKLQEHPELFQQEEESKLALDRAFTAAAATGDLQFVPILTQFSLSSDSAISRYANDSLTQLKTGSGTTILPRRDESLSAGCIF